jgi:hypothetical protein
MSVFSPRFRTWICRTGVAGTLAAIGLLASGAVLSPASADEPVKTGWWNAAAAGGTAAPGPDVNAGGIRVAVASDQLMSFGAVQYSLAPDASATLVLSITHMSGNSNVPAVNTIVACPTVDANWNSGDDQDMADAPGFSCERRQYVGRLSSDGTTLTFNVDGGADVSDGVLSLAILPLHTQQLPPPIGTDPGTGTDLTPPFVVDFDKPSAAAFTPDESSSSSDGGSGDGSTVTPTDTGSTGSTAVPGAPSVPTSGNVNVPPMTTDAGQSPVVAGQPAGAGTGTGATTPAAAITPTGAIDQNKRDLLLVLLILLLFGILYTQNAMQRTPRALVGPRANTPDGDAAGAAAAMAVPYPVGYGAPRGLGRFAKPRSGSARPLL